MTTEQLLYVAIGGGALIVVLLLFVLGLLVGGRRSRSAAIAGVALPPGAEALGPAFAQINNQLGEMGARVSDTVALLGTLTSAQTREQIQREAEEKRAQESYEALKRLSYTLLGSARAGATGERIVAEALAALPPQWLLTSHKVGNKVVEYAIALADGMILPIDSKVVAQAQLDALDRTEDQREREKLEREIRAAVLSRAAEVRQYVDGRTPGFAIAAVSDAAYRLCGAVLPTAYKDHQALIVPYSLLGPFVLMIYEQHRRSGVDLDTALRAQALAEAENHLKRAADEVNGRMSNALTQFRNGFDELSQELGRAARAVESLRSGTESKATKNGRA